jgi:hypothetical protein
MRDLRYLAGLVLLAGLLLGAAVPQAKDILKGKDLGAARDSLWDEGHAYRQWIFDQNSVNDDNANLDREIKFTANGHLRRHPTRVYFYNEISTAVRKAKDTGRPLAFYVFDHTCSDCLFILPQLYRRPAVVNASQDFVNCYVELPRQQREATEHGLMASQLTVQFFLPGMRRLRVVDNPDEQKLLQSYAEMKAYCAKLDDAAKFAEPRQGFAPSQSGY